MKANLTQMVEVRPYDCPIGVNEFQVKAGEVLRSPVADMCASIENWSKS